MNGPRSSRPLRLWQFSIAQLLGATTLICVAVALSRQLAIEDGLAKLMISALLGISITSAALAALFGLRAEMNRGDGHHRTRRRQFSLAQLLAMVGLLSLGLGVSRYYLDHPQMVQFLITAMLVVLAIGSTAAALLGAPVLLTVIAGTAMPDRQRCGLCVMLAVTAVYGLAFWVLVLD